MSTLIVASSFQRIVEDCIAGEITKEKALKLLKNKYNSACINIKEALGIDHISFCCYVPCDLDEWIKVCDGAERHNHSPDRIDCDNKIQYVIEKVSARYKDYDLNIGNATGEVYAEVHQIQNFCRENREIEDLYKKSQDEIEGVSDNEKMADVPQYILRPEETPENIQKEIERTIAILLKEQKIIKHKNNKDNSISYWIAETETVSKIQCSLKAKLKSEEIIIPKNEHIDDFIKKHLRSQKGNPLSETVRMANKRAERAKPKNTEQKRINTN